MNSTLFNFLKDNQMSLIHFIHHGATMTILVKTRTPYLSVEQLYLDYVLNGKISIKFNIKQTFCDICTKQQAEYIINDTVNPYTPHQSDRYICDLCYKQYTINAKQGNFLYIGYGDKHIIYDLQYLYIYNKKHLYYEKYEIPLQYYKNIGDLFVDAYCDVCQRFNNIDNHIDCYQYSNLYYIQYYVQHYLLLSQLNMIDDVIGIIKNFYTQIKL